MTSDIPSRESLTVAFQEAPKAGCADRADIEGVVGLANAQGGVLYLGLEADGAVGGLGQVGAVDPSQIAATVASNTVPPLVVRVEIVVADGRVIRRRLMGDKTPENVPLYPFEFTSTLSDLVRLDVTDTLCAGAVCEDLDPSERELLRRIIRSNQGEGRLSELTDDAPDRTLGLVWEDACGGLRPTVCGMLLIGKASRLRELIPTASVVFQRMRASDVFLQEHMRLPLLRCLERLLELFESANAQERTEKGGSEDAVPDFAPEAFSQALINAVCHRDYAWLGSVRVCLDESGLAVSSPGGFVRGIGADNLLIAEPQTRNTRLADTLRRIGLACGRGIAKVEEACARYARLRPDYSESTPECARVTFARSAADVAFAHWLEAMEKRRQARFGIVDLLILSTLRRRGSLSLGALVLQTGLPKTKLQWATQALLEEGVMEERSGGRSALSAQAQSAGRRLPAKRARCDKAQCPNVVIDLIGKMGAVSNADVSAALGLSPQSAYLLLRDMTAAGLIRRTGQKRYSRYRLPFKAR